MLNVWLGLGTNTTWLGLGWFGLKVRKCFFLFEKNTLLGPSTFVAL